MFDCLADDAGEVARGAARSSYLDDDHTRTSNAPSRIARGDERMNAASRDYTDTDGFRYDSKWIESVRPGRIPIFGRSVLLPGGMKSTQAVVQQKLP